MEFARVIHDLGTLRVATADSGGPGDIGEALFNQILATFRLAR